MRKALTTAAVTASTAALVLAGCSAPGGGDSDDGLTQVEIAVSNPTLFSTGLPFYVARDQGFFEDEGIEVSATFTGGGSETVQAVVSGSADIGAETSAPAAVGAFGAGAPIKIVAASTTGLDILWFAKAGSGIDSAEDMAGRPVGYSSTGSSSHIGVLELNDQVTSEGLPPIDVQVIGGPAENYTAVETGQIDAGWTQPPFFLEQIESGELTEVADGADIERYQDVAVRVYIANDSFLDEDPDAAKAYFRAVDRAYDWIFENQEDAVDLWLEDTDLDVDRDALLATFDYLDRDSYRTSPLDGQDVILEDAQKFDFITSPLTGDQEQTLFDTSYMPEDSR